LSPGGLIATRKVPRYHQARYSRAEEAWSAFRVLSTKRPTVFSKSSSRTWSEMQKCVKFISCGDKS
jgi:hypothetical protein